MRICHMHTHQRITSTLAVHALVYIPNSVTPHNIRNRFVPRARPRQRANLENSSDSRQQHLAFPGSVLGIVTVDSPDLVRNPTGANSLSCSTIPLLLRRINCIRLPDRRKYLGMQKFLWQMHWGFENTEIKNKTWLYGPYGR